VYNVIGHVLAGKYQVERVLGQGGMGIVVQAFHVQLGQRVAIKFVLPEVMHNPEVHGRFLREAQAAALLKSAHVARVIDIGSLENGAPYMVMEYLDGENLEALLRRVGPLPVATAAAWLLEACEAVAEAHALGIIHRDLKPANLFLAHGAGGLQSIKVFDFGISKLMSTSSLEPSLTRTASVMGSPTYASPEQLRSTKDVDHRTDIWALGVTLYQLVSADIPWKADTLPELSIKVAVDPPPPLPAQLGVPAAFEQIIRRCLEKEPGRRYASIAALAEALGPFAPEGRVAVDRVRRTSHIAAGPATTMGGSAGEIRSPRSRGRTLGIIGAIVLTSVVAGAILTFGGKDSKGKTGATDPRLAVSSPGASQPPPVAPPVVAPPPGTAPPPPVAPPVVAQIPDAAVAPPVVAQIPDAGPPRPVVAAASPPVTPPSPGGRYRDLVSAAQRLGKFSCSSAAGIYETAIDLNPRGVEALTGLGRCLLELKDYDRAISNFRAALAISRRNPEALFGAAEAYQLKGNVPAAIAHYKEYLEAAPHGARAEPAKSALAKLSPGEQTSDDPLGTGKPK
jgi:tetratricopeptide (TPR) repeat protein/tRNA A-37 threonylcarbamoyl transferase component Bud32